MHKISLLTNVKINGLLRGDGIRGKASVNLIHEMEWMEKKSGGRSKREVKTGGQVCNICNR